MRRGLVTEKMEANVAKLYDANVENCQLKMGKQENGCGEGRVVGKFEYCIKECGIQKLCGAL